MFTNKVAGFVQRPLRRREQGHRALKTLMQISALTAPALSFQNAWRGVIGIVVVALLPVFGLTGCGLNEVGSSTAPSTSGLTYRETYAWPLSTPGVQGMDSARALAGLQAIRNTPAVNSVLVVKNDFLVLEYYALGFIKDNDFHVGSVSASVISALVGLALEQRNIRSVKDGVFEYLPAVDGAGDDQQKRTWTIEHFLTMRAGSEWNEYDDHSHLYNSSTNWVSVSLGLPVRYAPGDTFIFASPYAHLLSAIITRATRMSTYNFAKQFLFDPLGISVRAWNTDPQGVFLGGSGMRFTPRDLARIGQLYLRNGYLDGKQIIPRSWIEQSLVPRNRTNVVKGDLGSLNFGYLWWTNVGGGDSLFAAFGYGGQAVYVVPSRSMVIVTLADETVARQQAEENELAIIAIVRRYFF